jgi:hypothetical protein
MAEHAALARLLAEFGRTSGIGSLALDASGVCALAFDGEVIIHLAAEADDAALLYVAVGQPVPEPLQAAMYRRFLEANARGGGPRAVRLALDPRDGAPLLCCPIAADRLSYAEFEAALLWLADAAETWSAELRSPPAAASGAADGALASGSWGGMIRA